MAFLRRPGPKGEFFSLTDSVPAFCFIQQACLCQMPVKVKLPTGEGKHAIGYRLGKVFILL